VSNIKAKNL